MPQNPYSVNCGARRWGAGSEHWTQCPFCYISLSTSFLPKNAPISSAQLCHGQAFHCSGFSSLFPYSATTLEGLSWAPVCSARVTPVPALVACQLIPETSLHSTIMY